MRFQTIVAAACLLAAGCQSFGGSEAADDTAIYPLKATLSGEACPDIGDRAYFFWMEPRSAEPGDKIALFPYWTDMPGSYNDLPPGCLDGLSVYPEGAATFARQDDGLAIATIAASVEPGSTLRLEGSYKGHSLTGRVDVYAEEANPLVGVWRQDGAQCPANSTILELVFNAANEMTVTWTPFEVYKDYWADYTFDPETGAFSFQVDGGNQVPEDIVTSGAIHLEGDTLTFDTVFLGTPRQAEGACSGSFTRLAGAPS